MMVVVVVNAPINMKCAYQYDNNTKVFAGKVRDHVDGGCGGGKCAYQYESPGSC